MSEKKKEIIIGAADVYMYEFNGPEIPEHAVIETEDHMVGHTSGGASVEYKPTAYEVENSYGKVVKKFVTKEEVTAKTGLLTWDLSKIKLLSTAVFLETAAKRTLTFTGAGNLPNVLVRFKHKKDDGKFLRFTMIGQGGNGFNVEFSTKETAIDSEIQAVETIKNFLAEFEEEISSAPVV